MQAQLQNAQCHSLLILLSMLNELTTRACCILNPHLVVDPPWRAAETATSPKGRGYFANRNSDRINPHPSKINLRH